MLPPLPPPPWERESAPSAARVPSISRRWEMFKKIVPPPAPEREFKSNLLASTYKFLLSDRWFISTSQGLLKRYHSKERKKERKKGETSDSRSRFRACNTPSGSHLLHAYIFSTNLNLLGKFVERVKDTFLSFGSRWKLQYGGHVVSAAIFIEKLGFNSSRHLQQFKILCLYCEL